MAFQSFQSLQKSNSTKDLIISVLSQEWPLSARQIHSRIIKEFGKNVSYQAIHKVIVQLFSDGVLTKDGKNYALNESWIKNLKSSASLLESKYSKQPVYDFSELLKKDCVVYNFHGILELARFLIGVLMKLPNPENKPNIFLWMFIYSIIGIKDDDYKELKENFQKTPTYVFCSENNLVDQMLAEGLKKYGVKKVFFNVKSASVLQDTMIVGDYICHIWYDFEMKMQWFKQNRLPKKVEEFDLGKHFKSMQDEKAPITVIVAKNQAVANNIRKAYLGKKSKEFTSL